MRPPRRSCSSRARTARSRPPSTVSRVRTRAELLVGVLASAGVVVLVSAVVALLKPHVPVLSLGALYVLAVLPVAILWGTALAAVVSVSSMLVFNWFLLPPIHS